MPDRDVIEEAQTEPILTVMDYTMVGKRGSPDSSPQATLGLVRREELTDQEMDVLRLVSEGLTNNEIAERLPLKVSTVRLHVDNLMSKTGFTSRTELAVNAVESGFVARSGITAPGAGGT